MQILADDDWTTFFSESLARDKDHIRWPGLHLGTVLDSIEQDLGTKKPPKGDGSRDQWDTTRHSYIAGGFIWEHIVEQVMASQLDATDEGSIELVWCADCDVVFASDTIGVQWDLHGAHRTLAGNLDGTMLGDLVEYKATWKRLMHLGPADFRRWIMQVKAYLWLLSRYKNEIRTIVDFYIWGVAGDSYGSKTPKPMVRHWKLQFSPEELDAHWRMIESQTNQRELWRVKESS